MGFQDLQHSMNSVASPLEPCLSTYLHAAEDQSYTISDHALYVMKETDIDYINSDLSEAFKSDSLR